MPTAQRTDPFPARNFKVEIEGISVTAFSEVSGIEAEVPVVDNRPGSDKAPGPRKLPGEAHFTNIVLKRGMTDDHSLWDWMQKTLDGKIERKNVSIVLLNEAGEEALRFNCLNAWPTKWTGPTLNSTANEVAIETLEIAHEGLRL
jgi:phage tail-like protein